MAARNKRRRRRSRSRLGFLLKLLCAVTVIAALTLGATVFFRVEEIAVDGNERYTREEIIEISGIRQGDNLYGINKTKISGDMRRQLPYIEGVNIRRNLPSTILITVDECGAAATVAVPPPLPPEPPKTQTEDGEEKPPENPPKPAAEPWMISMKGKLLEPAGTEPPKLLVTGITPLDPAPGTMLSVPEAEEYKKEALLELLSALEELDRTEKVSQIDLLAGRMELRYLDRFTVRMPMEEDFVYKLNMLDEVVARTTEKHGEQASGRIDLTRGDYAVYSPDPA